jgi:hypothetical protein
MVPSFVDVDVVASVLSKDRVVPTIAQTSNSPFFELMSKDVATHVHHQPRSRPRMQTLVPEDIKTTSASWTWFTAVPRI